MTATDCDVLVLGLGPAGASAAAAAAARGLRVLALDRRTRAGEPVQCAELVPAMLAASGTPLGASTRQSVRRMMTSIEGEPALETADFPGRMIDRAEFDCALVARARGSGATCCLGATVRAVTTNGVSLADGRHFSAPVIVGADGPLSLLGRSLGVVNRERVYARQITVPLHADYDATDIFLDARYRGGYGWLFPCAGRAHIGVGVDPDGRARLRTYVAELHLRLQRQGRVGAGVMRTTGGVIPVGGMLTPFAQTAAGLRLLAGDAAGLTNPITGAGIYAALVSGQLAGEAAADWLAGDVQAGTTYAEELMDLMGVSLARAQMRRAELLQAGARGKPSRSVQRRAWIAFPEYWHEPTPLRTAVTA